jgi:hypothetical protein
MTLRAFSSSPARRWFSRRSRAFSRSTGSTGGLPEGVPSAWSAPRSRCLRHSEISEVYRPSRRSSAPLPALSSRSYSARISACSEPNSSLVEAAREPRDQVVADCPSHQHARPAPPTDPWWLPREGLLPRPQLHDSMPPPASPEADTEGPLALAVRRRPAGPQPRPRRPHPARRSCGHARATAPGPARWRWCAHPGRSPHEPAATG